MARRRESLKGFDNPAREHIEEIRRKKFFIGAKETNPLTEDLHHAVKSLSAELYTKDIHFLMELIQNAEDNEYLEGVKPTLEFVLIDKDITRSGAPATLLVFNNEVGFSRKNMDSLCSVGRSTKKGKRHQGFIGEKGIGFKSVFLVSSHPHIFSNGYRVMFREEPDQDCGIGYIVPEWVDATPTISDIRSVYASSKTKTLPSTTIVLPLRPDKVEAVKKQLLELHPELLLFLSKIRRLSVREKSAGRRAGSSLSAVSICSEINLMAVKDIKADSCIVHLSVQEAESETETMCRYYIYRQAFPVKPENRVHSREDIEEWLVSLAFPFGERLKRGASSVGIFAYLPTEMVTHFPFIVQADFILASSRETILLDNKWNFGILDCIPMAFRNAFLSCLRSNEAFKLSSIAQVFEFFPVKASSYPELNNINRGIRSLMQEEKVIPCEMFSNEKMVFCKPSETLRLLPHFRKFLCYAKEQGVSLDSISSHGRFIIHPSLDVEGYGKVLDFLGVRSVESGHWWYVKCIESCKFVEASEDIYVELLYFLACSWSLLSKSTIKEVPLIKYIAGDGKLNVCTVSDTQNTYRFHYAWDAEHHAWLTKWNSEFKCSNMMYFLPNSTQASVVNHKSGSTLRNWLQTSTGVVLTSVSDYNVSLNRSASDSKDKKFSIIVAHFLYHNHCKHLITEEEVFRICRSMPLVDNSGHVHVLKFKTLVPASGSQWSKLFGLHSAFRRNYDFDLGSVYGESAQFAGVCTPKKVLLTFLSKYTRAVDLPEISPPNLKLPAAASGLTPEQALLLLEWLQNLQRKGDSIPIHFIESIRHGKWMKTFSGFNSPNQCSLYDGREISVFAKVGSVLEDFSIIDQAYYDNKINLYMDQLKFLGVKLGSKDVTGLIVNHLRSLASSQISSKSVMSLLTLIRYLRADDTLSEDFLNNLKKEKWLKTSEGYVAPGESVFVLAEEREAILQITSLPCVDDMFYGSEINSFSDELKLLGVVVDVEKAYKRIINNFKLPADLSTMSKLCLLLILKCIRSLGPQAVGLIEQIKDQSWLKTTVGIRCPSESVLPGVEWRYMLNDAMMPLIDEDYYGAEIRLFTHELKEIGVSVDLDGAFKIMSNQVKSLSSSGSLTNITVLSVLNSIKLAGASMPNCVSQLRSFLLEVKWLKTRHGYRSASGSILFDLKWGTVSQFVDLPLIDDTFYGIEIYEYKDELQMLGVVINFSEGAHFVARGLNSPKEPKLVTAEGALSLLQCIRFMMKEEDNSTTDQSLRQGFLEKLRSSKWLKTNMGYNTPDECLLYNPNWGDILSMGDAAFIDENFYGDSVYLYKEELEAVGVKVDAEQICAVLASVLCSCTQTSAITRIYEFLHKFKWHAEFSDKSDTQVWLPTQSSTDGGEWVSSQTCLLHDSDALFSSRFHVLDYYYDEGLLPVFPSAFGVAEAPSVQDYVNLWNIWESNSTSNVLPMRCCSSFWAFIIDNWNQRMEEMLKKSITKLPAVFKSGNEIELVEMEELFMPDNLELKKLFSNATEEPLFVWSPQSGSMSVKKLYDIYGILGVKKLSDCVEFGACTAMSEGGKFQVMNPRNGLIEKGLIKIVLAFLAHPQIDMPFKDRCDAVNPLLHVSVFETNEPIKVICSLVFPSSKKRLDAKTNKLIYWEKVSGRLFVCTTGKQDDKTSIEFNITFAKSIASGLLEGRPDLVPSLSNMIRMGFSHGFEEEAMDTLLMEENLELYSEDRDFLDVAYSSEQTHSSIPCKRSSSKLEVSKECTFICYKKKR